MISRSALRASASSPILARRGFHSTRARLSSPYHYPEGPRSNIPFDPLNKYFFYQYWGTISESDSSCPALSLTGCKAFFFGLPFVIAGTFIMMVRKLHCLKRYCSLANEEEQVGAFGLGCLLQIQSSLTAFWQRLRKKSRVVHTSERNSGQQADLCGDLAVSIGVLALILRLFSRPIVIG